MAINWKKKYEENKIIIDNLEGLLDFEKKKNKELDDIIREYNKIEENKELYANFKQGEYYKNMFEHYKRLFEEERELSQKLKNEANSNSQALEKARETKKNIQEKKIEDYKVKISEILGIQRKVTTKELLKELNINNKTFYNLKLNEFYKSVK